jgi:hypothetical protein
MLQTCPERFFTFKRLLRANFAESVQTASPEFTNNHLLKVKVFLGSFSASASVTRQAKASFRDCCKGNTILWLV